MTIERCQVASRRPIRDNEVINCSRSKVEYGVNSRPVIVRTLSTEANFDQATLIFKSRTLITSSWLYSRGKLINCIKPISISVGHRAARQRYHIELLLTFQSSFIKRSPPSRIPIRSLVVTSPGSHLPDSTLFIRRLPTHSTQHKLTRSNWPSGRPMLTIAENTPHTNVSYHSPLTESLTHSSVVQSCDKKQKNGKKSLIELLITHNDIRQK